MIYIYIPIYVFENAYALILFDIDRRRVHFEVGIEKYVSFIHLGWEFCFEAADRDVVSPDRVQALG